MSPSLETTFWPFQEAVHHEHRFAAVVGLRINASQTKIVSALVDLPLYQAFNAAVESLGKVSSFKYLAAFFTATRQDKLER